MGKVLWKLFYTFVLTVFYIVVGLVGLMALFILVGLMAALLEAYPHFYAVLGFLIIWASVFHYNWKK